MNACVKYGSLHAYRKRGEEGYGKGVKYFLFKVNQFEKFASRSAM